jgi:type I restriction enzyme, S subunit
MSEKKELPMGWIPTTLGEIAEVIMGQSPPSETYNTVGAGLPFFQGKAEFTDLHPVAKKWCSRPNKIAFQDDVLLSVRAPVGATNVADRECCIGRGLAAVRYQHNHRLIYYFLRLAEKDLDEKGTGTTFRAISGEVVRNTEFTLPPLPEQHRIVAKIEELFSSLDKGIEDLKTAQQQLKVYRQAVLKWAFEGRLTNKNVADGELPEGWKIVRLEEICDPNRKCSYGVLVPGEHVENGVTLLRVGDIDNCGRIDQTNMKRISPVIANKFKRTFLEGGEVVMSLVGAIGRTAVVPSSLRGANTARAVGVIPVAATVCARYVEAMLRSPSKIKEHNDSSHEVARKTLNLEDVIKSQIPFPPSFEEQQLIVSEIESRLSVCDKIEETITDSLTQAESLRQSILKKAFEGKLVPQDPKDEPASVLLARIKAEREENSRGKVRVGAAR